MLEKTLHNFTVLQHLKSDLIAKNRQIPLKLDDLSNELFIEPSIISAFIPRLKPYKSQ